MAAVELAYTMPVLLTLGLMGTEVANLAITNMKLSQTSLTAADNASRLGDDQLAVRKLREQDIVDVFEAANLQARSMDLFVHGRMIVSSVQRNNEGKQTIAWQRCRGTKPIASSAFGNQGTTEPNASLALPGIRNTGRSVKAGPDSAVILVETYYDYQPIANFAFSSIGARTMESIAVFTVRDRRDLTNISNLNSAHVYNCNQFTQ